MIYHLLIIKHLIKDKMNIIHHISWVNSLNNDPFCLGSNITLFYYLTDSPKYHNTEHLDLCNP